MNNRPILPSQPYHPSTIEWNPEPYWATICEDGVAPHPEPDNPQSSLKVYLAVEISSTKFHRYAAYYPSLGRHHSYYQDLGRWTEHAVFLLSDDKDDEIYCVSSGKFFPFLLFGKLVRDNIIYYLCSQAFAKIGQK